MTFSETQMLSKIKKYITNQNAYKKFINYSNKFIFIFKAARSMVPFFGINTCSISDAYHPIFLSQ